MVDLRSKDSGPSSGFIEHLSMQLGLRLFRGRKLVLTNCLPVAKYKRYFLHSNVDVSVFNLSIK